MKIFRFETETRLPRPREEIFRFFADARNLSLLTPRRFVDEQRRGPYRQWIHEHTFAEQDGGTVASDRVDYAVPGGAIANRVLVARDLEKIFAFRQEILRKKFG